MEILLATTNKGKLKEFKQLLKGLNLKFISLNTNIDIKENGKNYRENAIKKAKIAHQIYGKITLAEDSGLEIESLNNQPGIYSARFAKTDFLRNKKILRLLKNKSSRKAKFISVVALIFQNNKIIVKTGICKGTISFEPHGDDGFGFDPIFIPNKYNKTFGELGEKIKNQISHRARAFKKIRKVLIQILTATPFAADS